MTGLRRTTAPFVTAVTLALVLAACGDDVTQATPADAPSSAEQEEVAFNAADVTFAQGMIVHHRGALHMAEMALDQSEDPEVLALAEEIATAQEPEIQTMTSFLETWGEEVPAEDEGGMDMGDMDMGSGDMGSGDMDMPGMMSPEQMEELAAAEGDEFDRMWLEMMTVHHEGAVEMAQTELAEGEDPAALDLAQEIADAQESEIERMQGMLSS